MKKIILHFAFCIFALIFVACHTPRGNDTSAKESIVAADTLIAATGNAELDSLLQAAAVARPDTTLALLYYEIAEKYKDNDVEQSKAYFLKLEKLSEELDWNKGRYSFFMGFSLILSRERLGDSALAVCQKALEIAQLERNDVWIANANISIGNSFLSKQWNQTALQYYTEALSIFERTNNTEGI